MGSFYGGNTGPAGQCTGRVLKLNDLTVLQLHLEGPEALADPQPFSRLRNRAFFASASNRKVINEGHADYVPMFLSEIPKLFRSGRQKVVNWTSS